MDTVGVRKELAEYITSEIIPAYAAFDPAHRENHAEAVIENSMMLYRTAPDEIRERIDPEILITAAACHDIGRVNGKERHHIDSGKMVRADKNLRKWFDEAAIEAIAQAAEDHRASNGTEPRSIYGKIVAEADRLIDTETVIMRTLQYGLSRYPDMTAEEQIDRTLDHLYGKYGENGYLKLLIPWGDNAAKLSRLRRLLANPEKARAAVTEAYRRLNPHPCSDSL